MAGSINKVILVGNLGADPKVSNTTSGSKIVNLNIATSDTWKDKATGERKDRTEWHRVVILILSWRILPRDICAKVPRFIWKDSCKPANGKTTADRKDIRPKLCCRISAAIWFC